MVKSHFSGNLLFSVVALFLSLHIARKRIYIFANNIGVGLNYGAAWLTFDSELKLLAILSA